VVLHHGVTRAHVLFSVGQQGQIPSIQTCGGGGTQPVGARVWALVCKQKFDVRGAGSQRPCLPSDAMLLYLVMRAYALQAASALRTSAVMSSSRRFGPICARGRGGQRKTGLRVVWPLVRIHL
jgi:hypothetical protein